MQNSLQTIYGTITSQTVANEHILKLYGSLKSQEVFKHRCCTSRFKTWAARGPLWQEGWHTYFSLPRRLGWDFWASCLALRSFCLALVFSSCFLMEDFMERSWKSCCCWPVCCLSANRSCSWNDWGRVNIWHSQFENDCFRDHRHVRGYKGLFFSTVS